MITEQKIQSKIKKYAESKGWIVVKTIKLSSAGFPDLFLFKNGKTIFIEVKKENGIISPLQILRQKQLQKENFICEFCYSLEQFKTIINETT